MGVYYKKTHKIAGINFLPRLTLAEYNNLTVKPEHWVRTDSPFDYSKTDVPKLTLSQYEGLAIKPKFWIRTDAPQSYTNISATQVDMTDSVSVYDYLTDLDANQVEYSTGVSVKDKIDDLMSFLNGRDYTDTNYGNNLYKLRGKTVTLIIEGRTNITLGAWGNVQIGQVPQDMRPAYSFNYPLPLQAADNSQRNVILTVSQGGVISFINQSGGSVTVGATLRTTVTYNI